jgi:hypothetical protein
MIHDINYWNDYSIFINRTEDLTGMNASRLIEKYEKLIEELENKETLEGLYEGFEEKNTIQEINKILTAPSLETNKLKNEFQNTIENLDKRIYPFLKKDIVITKSRKAKFQTDQIEWNK